MRHESIGHVVRVTILADEITVVGFPQLGVLDPGSTTCALTTL